MERNCTAAFTSFFCKPSGWVALPCTKKFHISAICTNKQSESAVTPVINDTRRGSLINHSKLSCQNNWVLLGEKCLYLMTFNTSVSFDDAQYECSSHGSKLLSVEKVTAPYPYKYNLNLNLDMKVLGIKMPEMDLLTQTRLLTGIPFLKNSNYDIDYMRDLFFILTSNMEFYLPVIEYSTKDCWIAELGFQKGATVYTPSGAARHNYGMKRRFCSAPINGSSFTCEKQPIVLNMTCGVYQFRCEDDSCILLVYLCDGVYDCLTKEDEAECPLMRYNTDGIVTINSNNNLMVPCVKSNKVANITGDKELITYVPVHSLCDGEHVCNIMSEEQCTYTTMHYIDFSSYGNIKPYQYNDEMGRGFNKMWIEEIRHYILLQKGYKADNEPQYKNYEVTSLQVLCNIDKVYYNFTDYCYITDRHPCTYGEHSRACSQLLCPGMFKCIQSFCIRISSVCDGHIDCPVGEDEMNCLNLSCNGFLKCRNEHRCVGLRQICDGIIDCRYSYDDELYCGECPMFCNCTGYITRCTGLHADTYRLITASYAKSIVFKTIIKRVLIQNMLTRALVYIDLSACEIQSMISNSHNNGTKHFLNVLYANLSNNFIENDAVLTYIEFSKLVILDVSNNYITFLGNHAIKYLYNLKILIFDKNPIIRFELNVFKYITGTLTILSVKHVYFHQRIFVIKIDQYLNFTLVVDKSSFCCHFYENVNCIVKTGMVSNSICNGLIHTNAQLLIFRCLTTLAFLISVIFTGYYVYSVSQARHNYLFHIFINTGVSEMLLSVYLICLAIANDINVNVVDWRKSLYCIIFHALFSVSLAANIIFKVLSSYVLLLKIVYPFKHQCRYVKMSWLICLLVWTILTVSHTLFLSYVDTDILYSLFCTIWCQNSNLTYLNIFIIILELITFGLVTLCIQLIAIRLNQSASTFKNNVDSKRTLKVTLPIVLEILGDIYLRFPITAIVILHILEEHKLKTYCESVILYLLPTKIIFCSCSRILFKFFK